MATKFTSGKILKYIHSSSPLRINDIGGWTDTWFSGDGNVLNIAVSPHVKILIKVRKNAKKIQERVIIYAANYGERFTVNPENPRYDHHPILQGAVNSIPIPEEADRVIEIAKEYQASGWKVNGAGGYGGSLTILGNEDEKLRTVMIKKINELGNEIRTIPISLSSKGLTIRTSRSLSKDEWTQI
jgi:galactokinase/mevalonate kinase-like predicted kinase